MKAMRPWPRAAYILGFAALFSGVALLLSVLLAVWLPAGLAATGITAVGIGTFLMRRAPRVERRYLGRIILAGLIGGVLATICYDVARHLISFFEPTRYDPWLAIRAFGSLLVGEDATIGAQLVAGSLFHLVNGTAFGVGYCLFFGRFGRISNRHALATGIGWGLFLETFQLTLYPGWLDIRAVQEFAAISFTAHVIYGAVLGLTSRATLVRLFRGAPGDTAGSASIGP